MNKIRTAIIGVLLSAVTVIHAQTVTSTSAGLSLSFGGVTVPAIAGTPITIDGQTLLIATNASGGYTVVTYGTYGATNFTPPTTLGGVGTFVQNAVENNNAANISYYSTNGEWDVSLGAAYAQNSGNAAVQLSIEKYGIIKAWPQASLGLAVLEGNQNGQNGTAAGYGFVDYRKPIGDVAFIFGGGGGYDNFTGKPMLILKGEVEYRQNKHIGEFAGAGYDLEGFGKTKTQVGSSVSNPSGLVVAGGIRCAF
jgi:hypothetical protein